MQTSIRVYFLSKFYVIYFTAVRQTSSYLPQMVALVLFKFTHEKRKLFKAKLHPLNKQNSLQLWSRLSCSTTCSAAKHEEI